MNCSNFFSSFLAKFLPVLYLSDSFFIFLHTQASENVDWLTFYQCEDSNIANYADDITPYTYGVIMRAEISELQSLAFSNGLKRIMRKLTEKVKIDDAVLTWSAEEKLLITLDFEHKFEKHITDICNKTSQKIYMFWPELQVIVAE